METMQVDNELVDFQRYSFSESQTYDASVCIMTKITALMSGRWKPIILHLIKNDINRFGLLQKSMPLISKKVLSVANFSAVFCLIEISFPLSSYQA